MLPLTPFNTLELCQPDPATGKYLQCLFFCLCGGAEPPAWRWLMAEDYQVQPVLSSC